MGKRRRRLRSNSAVKGLRDEDHGGGGTPRDGEGRMCAGVRETKGGVSVGCGCTEVDS